MSDTITEKGGNLAPTPPRHLPRKLQITAAQIVTVKSGIAVVALAVYCQYALSKLAFTFTFTSPISRESWTTQNVYRSCASVCLPVCVFVPCRIPTLQHGPGYNLGNGRVCPLVVHYWADLQSVHGYSCYETYVLHFCVIINIYSANAKCERVLVLALCLQV